MDLIRSELTQPYQTLELDLSPDWKPNQGKILSWKVARLGKLGDAELALKAEILLTRVLREKLCHKELELEQLQAEPATSVRGHDILRCENQRSQDAVSSLTHKMKDLELQILTPPCAEER
ncbi:hypothetical protein MRB53_009454 [Persea americana]|uniref:Uncharacterized protein n=1 Tax=Persea americana TaxID=3435 RepID=A0ACC2LP21_PERAE|nr:hypothetical protein MRB53_009454 [Persea americana]